MTTGIKSAGVDLDAIFDLYVEGTSPGLTGYKDAGVDIHTRYAPLIYGIQAARTYLLCKVSGLGSFVDLNTLFAKIGTASYALSINGNTYEHSYSVVSGTASSTIGFSTTSSTWKVYGSDSLHAPTVLASGSNPSGSVKIQFTWGAYTVPTGFIDSGGATYNSASTPQLLSSAQDAHYTTATVGSLSASRARNYIFTIDFFDSSLRNISHTVIHMIGEIEGSS